MSHPIIRVFLEGEDREKPIYRGPHACIPRIGEHICVQYWTHRVSRVEHILGFSFDDEPIKADVFLEKEKS